MAQHTTGEIANSPFTAIHIHIWVFDCECVTSNGGFSFTREERVCLVSVKCITYTRV